MPCTVLTFRKKYEGVIIKLTQSADMYSRMFAETGDPFCLTAYHNAVKQICDLKEFIISEEGKINVKHLGDK
jgi:hypothetical protein